MLYYIRREVLVDDCLNQVTQEFGRISPVSRSPGVLILEDKVAGTSPS